MPSRDVIFRIIGEDAATPAFTSAAASAEGAAARISRASDRMVTTGSKLSKAITLPVIAIGAVSVKAAADFNASMTRIHTQAGGSARDVKVLSDQVLNLAKTAQQGPNELAQALYHLKSVGLDNVDAMKALRQASDFAAVGGANLEETTNALAGAWRTGITGARNFHQAVSTLNAIIGAGNMKMGDLNAALGTGILPTAKTFGLTLKDVGSALAVFTDEGVPADAAATRLRMSMSLLGAPSAAAEKHLADIGLTGLKLANDMRKPNGLIMAIGDLKSHLEDPKYKLSLSEQAQLLSHAFGGGRSSSAILSLVNNFGVLQQKQEQVTRGMAKFNAAVAAQRLTPSAQFHELEASLQRTAILIGDDVLPVVVGLAHGIGDVTSAFGGLSPSMRKAIVDAALIAAAIGPIMVVTGKLARAFPLMWRAATIPARTLYGWDAASKSAASTGTAVERTAMATNAATRDMSAAQLSQASAAERAAAVIAVAEANKAKAAAEGAAATARALEGSDSILAADAKAAATNAEQFSLAMKARADAAVASAARITVASEESTRALGRGQLAGSVGRGSKIATGIGMGVGFGGIIAGQAIGGKTGNVLSSAGTGALLGSAAGPFGAIGGAIIGTGLASSGGGLPGAVSDKIGVGSVMAQVAKLPESIRFAVQHSQKYIAALNTALSHPSADTTKSLASVANAVRNQATAEYNAAAPTRTLASTTKYLGTVSDTAGKKLISLSDALNNLDRGMLNLADANISFRLGLKALPSQLDKHSKALYGDSKAALTNRQALVGLLGQVKAHAQAMQAAGKQAPAVAKAINTDVHALEQTAIKAGISKSAFQRLIAQMHLTPKQVHTSVVADTTSATAKLQTLQGLLNQIANGAYVAHVTATGSINVAGANVAGGTYGGHFAAGGTIPPNHVFTVGEQGFEGGVSDGQGRVRIFSHPQSRAMGFRSPSGYAGGTTQSGGRGRRTIRLHIDLGDELRPIIRDVVLDELDYA